jgi:hypothetical protein
MKDRKWEAFLAAARRMDQAADKDLRSPGPKARAELIEAEAEYAKALDDLQTVSENDLIS